MPDVELYDINQAYLQEKPLEVLRDEFIELMTENYSILTEDLVDLEEEERSLIILDVPEEAKVELQVEIENLSYLDRSDQELVFCDYGISETASNSVLSSGVYTQEDHIRIYFKQILINGVKYSINRSGTKFSGFYTASDYPKYTNGEFKLRPVFKDKAPIPQLNKNYYKWHRGAPRFGTIDLLEAPLVNSLEVAANKVDKCNRLKRLNNKPGLEYQYLDKSEASKFEVALHSIHPEGNKVIQVLGHVAFYKATYYVDPELYPSLTTKVEVVQVWKKATTLGKRKLNWDQESYTVEELPFMIDPSDERFTKKIKYLNQANKFLVKCGPNSIYV
jgi:hypothetical protein